MNIFVSTILNVFIDIFPFFIYVFLTWFSYIFQINDKKAKAAQAVVVPRLAAFCNVCLSDKDGATVTAPRMSETDSWDLCIISMCSLRYIALCDSVRYKNKINILRGVFKRRKNYLI